MQSFLATLRAAGSFPKRNPRTFPKHRPDIPQASLLQDGDDGDIDDDDARDAATERERDDDAHDEGFADKYESGYGDDGVVVDDGEDEEEDEENYCDDNDADDADDGVVDDDDDGDGDDDDDADLKACERSAVGHKHDSPCKHLKA